MKVKKVWFDSDQIYILDERGRTLHQSLLWYKQLMNASEEERQNYTVGFTGLHWRNLDEDISFESFEYEDAEPSALQRFFLEHKELNIAEFAKRIGMNATLLRNYINGFKKPSKERERVILKAIQDLGREYVAVIPTPYMIEDSVIPVASEPDC